MLVRDSKAKIAMSLEPIEPETAVELYLEDRENELSQRSLYGHKSRLGHFTRWCEDDEISNINERRTYLDDV